MTPFAERRTTMVDTQVRPSDVTAFPIIAAMLAIPREAYVPASAREIAYADTDIPLGEGRVVLAPRVLARMLDAAEIGPGELVLLVGTGLGYSAAVIARMAQAVVALEESPDLAREAEQILTAETVDNVALSRGPLVAGDPRHAPYDVIVIDGGIEVLPRALTDQLREGGRIIALRMEGHLGRIEIGHLSNGVLSWRFCCNATAPVLPGFAAERAFVL